MKRFIRYIRSRMTMTLVSYGYFEDAVEKVPVNLYVDCYGDYYMASSRFSFRVKSTRSLRKKEKIFKK